MAHLMYTYNLRVQDRQNRTIGYHLPLPINHSIWFCVCIGLTNHRRLTEHGHPHQYSEPTQPDSQSESSYPFFIFILFINYSFESQTSSVILDDISGIRLTLSGISHIRRHIKSTK